ncbi:MAG: Rid family detoxifying hydrolase [bacterium]|nr:Rid family detoxifying hydrolase [bacterium]MDD2943104.1 Rid family detoxifying hydrolase [bacterium]
MEVIKDVAGAPAPVGAYSPATKASGLVFCAGQIALDPATGKLVAGGVAEQTKRVLDNLSAVLEAAGSDWSSVLMSTIFLADIGSAPEVNALYGAMVNVEAAPARQTLAVKDLPLGALVEISLIAESRS